MATLDVPLHIPVSQLDPFLKRELRFSEVTSFEVCAGYVRIEHHRLPAHEIIADLESCVEPLTFV